MFEKEERTAIEKQLKREREKNKNKKKKKKKTYQI